MGELVQLEAGSFVKGWKIERKLGEGAFGAVYVCSHEQKTYALKVESVNEKVGFLKMELVVLLKLRDNGRTRHFCTIEDKGRFKDFFYIVMTMVGRSLQDLRKEMPKKKFSMGTAISVGIKCLEALEDLHNIGYLHRDVKPGNFAVGRAEVNELRSVYVLDFGMAREYVHADGRMRNPRALTGFRGTVKYAPLSCHILRELCRKDDVESWLYMVVEITCGKLPWRNLTEINAVGIYKKNCRKDKGVKRLFGGCPRKYVDILRICDKTKFFDTPDYNRIYEIMGECIRDTNSTEYPYDWEKDANKVEEDDKVAVVTQCEGTSAYQGQSKMQSEICINNEQPKSPRNSLPPYK